MNQVAGNGRKKLFLHIGMEKTGSTAIQGFLQMNLFELPKLGVFIAGRECRAGTMLLHHRLAKAFLSNQGIASHIPAASDEEWSHWLAELKESDCGVGVISSELFSYANAEDINNIAARLKDLDVKIVVFLRRQDSYVEAQYGQHIKGIYQLGGAPFSRDKFLAGNMNYEAFCGAWAGVFGAGNILVRLYDEDRQANALFENFCEAVGLSAKMDRLSLPQNTANPGLLEFPARVLLSLQDVIADKQTRAAIAELVINYNNEIGEKRPHSGRPKWLIPRQRREEILKMSAATNANVARLYLGREDGVLFPPKPEHENVETPPVDYNEVASLLAFVLSKLSLPRASLEADSK